ncbi:extracellular solute-binding protein family 3 [Methanococcus vannielii SB]|uniref:Extracellular solute-binding protein family 3 n=1 Tax=Methanococcus vannielii (strain ATCC 35089 / DSM 1224 / JCM 13029 / OCM 148 / SB) TaxID=406327 RepID=A6UQF4_METVS|nr:ABC transporter substrate-binding protein [Methanococcus vannielii]ABR54726.1 extracellular solute-binding protein family 3 [Methanococcus vannielii SB]
MKSLYIILITLLSPFSSIIDIGTDDYEITGVLTVGVYPNLPPYTYEENGELKGFEIDLLTEISKRMKVSPEFIPYNYNNEPYNAVKNRDIDCAISSNFLSAHKNEIKYSRAYLSTYEVILCSKNSKYYRLEDMKGKKIGVLKFSSSEEKGKYLLRSMNFIPVSYDNNEIMIEDLISGNIDAVITDKRYFNHLQEETDSIRFVQELDIKYISIAVNPKNQELVGKIDKILLEMEKDGTYAKIYEKWFSNAKSL